MAGFFVGGVRGPGCFVAGFFATGCFVAGCLVAGCFVAADAGFFALADVAADDARGVGDFRDVAGCRGAGARRGAGRGADCSAGSGSLDVLGALGTPVPSGGVAGLEEST